MKIGGMVLIFIECKFSLHYPFYLYSVILSVSFFYFFCNKFLYFDFVKDPKKLTQRM